MRIDLEGGKYTFVNDGFGRISALRYGEPWRDLFGDKFVNALAQEVVRLKAEVEYRDKTILALEVITLEASELARELAEQAAQMQSYRDVLQDVEGMLDELRDYPATHDAIITVLYLEPPQALKKYKNEVLEEAAVICEQVNSAGEGIAKIIREMKG